MKTKWHIRKQNKYKHFSDFNAVKTKFHIGKRNLKKNIFFIAIKWKSNSTFLFCDLWNSIKIKISNQTNAASKQNKFFYLVSSRFLSSLLSSRRKTLMLLSTRDENETKFSWNRRNKTRGRFYKSMFFILTITTCCEGKEVISECQMPQRKRNKNKYFLYNNVAKTKCHIR